MCAIKSGGSERDRAAGELKWPTSTDATDIQGDTVDVQTATNLTPLTTEAWAQTHFLQFYNISFIYVFILTFFPSYC